MIPEFPIISIIIPTYNNEAFIKETLDSVMKQTDQKWECVIVDDGSTDGTWDTLEYYSNKDKRFRIYKRNRAPKGANVCRNIGATEAKGEFITFLDADDLLSATCVRDRIEQIENNNGFDIAVFKMAHLRDELSENCDIVNRFRNSKDIDKTLNRFINYRIPWPVTSTLWKREFFYIIKFDEELDRFQDVDIHIRALNTRPDVLFYPHDKIDSFYRSSSFHKNITKDKKKVILNSGLVLLATLKRESLICSSQGMILFISYSTRDVVGLRNAMHFLFIYLRFTPLSQISIYAIVTLISSNKYLAKTNFFKKVSNKSYFNFSKRLDKRLI
nr:glycosyltransferase family 2 protein [uncultured Brumimicrobium sp.]